ncbi:putative elongation factor 1 delta [Apostichopus japonicus]|uniref:Putative elongation factor 1 delta n=1 Tax=Stichopus japonicus TaxID=307972 RepID=A0A2G8JN00_STIJA|nr:putative elongation factor 1 delta [Apostichopus japonicus]
MHWKRRLVHPVIVTYICSSLFQTKRKAEELKKQMKEAEAAKKKKKVVIAKSNIILDVKPGAGKKVEGSGGQTLSARMNALEKENENLKKVTSDLQTLVMQLQERVTVLEGGSGKSIPRLPKVPTSSQKQGEDEVDEDSDSDDDEDLFGNNKDTKRKAEELKKQMKEAEAAKKKKKVVIAKSNIILDVKPLGDDTDMESLREKVMTITTDGLVWGKSQFVDVAYGIKKLQITCVVEDDKVFVDDLEEQILEFDDLVQSVDVVAFNKV